MRRESVTGAVPPRLAETKGLPKHQDYQLASISGDVSVTQLVDKPHMGVHVKLPKSIFRGAEAESRIR
jgi:acetamidase/formamidase